MIVGIDLGTTNSLVAVFRGGVPTLVPNALGHFLTPSAVSIADDGSILVGLAARERLSVAPRSTAFAFKRWMGTDRAIPLGDRTMRAEELSAMVIRSLKADAEAFLGCEIAEAVVTVPAYFNDAQRRATKTAAELAGLKVERLLNEPTAAGLAYGLQERSDHSTFLVFDLGGGTFDVSVLEYFEGVVEVHASAGDTHLGGEDFVEVLVKWFLAAASGLDEEIRVSLQSDNALWRMAEAAKRELSEREVSTMTFQRGGQTHVLQVSRAEFELRCEPLLQRLRRPIERALMDARLSAEALSEVVLVGGASRMPMVRQLVTRLFARLPLRTINPDETIALGASIQAALKARDAALSEVVLTDVMPYSLGILATEQIGQHLLGGRFSPIIERNSPVPVSRSQVYTTMHDGQTLIELDIRQGESPIGSENLRLGVLSVPIPRAPRGTDVNVRFSYDINGLLEVEAEIPSSGNVVRSIIQRNGEQMTDEEITLSLERLRHLKVHPRDKQENVYLIERAKRLYADRLGDERAEIASALAHFEAALATQDERIMRQQMTRFSAFLNALDTGFTL